MATRIRLQRHGKKGKPFFHIVVADQRAKRDGRFIEKLGTYNPNTNPATILIDFDRSLDWVQKGAQPSDTARAILSYKGVLMKEHLLRGVQKGALTEEQAEAKFQKWLDEKEGKVSNKVETLAKKKEEETKARLAAEKEVSDARIASRKAQEAEALAAESAAEETPTEETAEAAPAEETQVEAAPAEEAKEEAPAEEVAEAAPAEEAKEEAPAEEVAEAAPAEEVKEEAPAEEVAEATPAEETKEEAPAEEVAEAAPAEEAKEEAPAEDAAADEEKKDA